MDQQSPLPSDAFSFELGRVLNNPSETHTRESTITARDFYGNTASYIVQTVRTEDSGDTVFIQRISQAGSWREVLPPTVIAAIVRQRDQLSTKNRRRGAQRAQVTLAQKGILPFGGKPHRRPPVRRKKTPVASGE